MLIGQSAQILRHTGNYLFLALPDPMTSCSDLLATPTIFPAGLKALYGQNSLPPLYISFITQHWDVLILHAVRPWPSQFTTLILRFLDHKMRDLKEMVP